MNRARLVSQLHDPGVRAGEVIMVHSSFRAVRPVDSGPEGLLEALLEAVGPGGTVMAYVSWDRSPYDGDNPRELSPDERRGWPAFDPATASAYPDWGVLLEVLCRHPCAVRSANPDNSFAAVGVARYGAMSRSSTRTASSMPRARRRSLTSRWWDAPTIACSTQAARFSTIWMPKRSSARTIPLSSRSNSRARSWPTIARSLPRAKRLPSRRT